MKRVLGIDPGIGGGAAVIEIAAPRRFTLLDAIQLPTIEEAHRRRIDVKSLAGWLHKLRADAGIIERAQAMPDQGASSGFNYGRTVGYLECLVIMCNVPLSTVETVFWKRRFGLIKTGKEDSRQAAIRIFGNDRFWPLKKDHNIAEAALIARYGAEQIFSGGRVEN